MKNKMRNGAKMMKKILSICGMGLLVISILGACSLFGGNKEPLNGFMLLGEEQALKKIEVEHKKRNKIHSIL
ncbi:hypothetical protein ACUIJ5_27860 (plasmid) [Bacillus toyonensis]